MLRHFTKQKKEDKWLLFRAVVSEFKIKFSVTLLWWLYLGYIVGRWDVMTLFWFYPSTVFSTFDMDQLGKIRHLEELWGSLKLVILPSFKVKCLKRAKLDIAPKNLRTSHLHPTTIQRFVNFHNFADLYISSLVFNKSLSNLAVFLILRRSYQRGGRIFPNLSMSKVKKKNRGKVYCD